MYKMLNIVFLVGLAAVGSVTDANGINVGERSLMNFIIRSSAMSQSNPQRSMACFDYYVPVLNSITAQYETNYAACIKSADDAKLEVDASTAPERESLEASASDACQILASCSAHDDSISYFECFVSGGSENSKTMYSISQNASDVLVNVREQFRLIDNQQYKCTNASERAYIDDTARTYEELQSCLQGKTEVPSQPEPTEGPTEGPTEEPETVPPPASAEPEEPLEPEEPQAFAAPKSQRSLKEKIRSRFARKH